MSGVKKTPPRRRVSVTIPTAAELPAAAAPDEVKWKEWTVTAKEALFLRCVLKAQVEQGMKPLHQLKVPSTIGVVVDYDIVKRLFYSQELREENADEDVRKKHLAAAKQALGRARRRLMHDGIIGCHDPFIWWTGKPVRGIKKTQKHDPSLFM
ncbi:hypothetical protein BH11PSE4_BH11PSE4_42840 [soil metagenome]